MLVNHNGKDIKLPDFLIVGASKSGTTSLHFYLQQHPMIFLPEGKELYFFSFRGALPEFAKEGPHRKRWDGRIAMKLDDYANYFKDAGEGQVMGEICPTYLYTYVDTIRNIKEIYGNRYKDLKIMMILRNPAERAWSDFMMHRMNDDEPIEDFREVIKPEVIESRFKNNFSIGFDYVGVGMYYEQVKAFKDEFPKTKVFLYEEFCDNSLNVIREIFGFLGVDAGFVPDTERRYNISGRPKSNLLNWLTEGRSPLRKLVKFVIPYNLRQKIKQMVEARNIRKHDMPEDLKKEMTVLYRGDVLKLQALIGKNLAAWIV